MALFGKGWQDKLATLGATFSDMGAGLNHSRAGYLDQLQAQRRFDAGQPQGQAKGWRDKLATLGATFSDMGGALNHSDGGYLDRLQARRRFGAEWQRRQDEAKPTAATAAAGAVTSTLPGYVGAARAASRALRYGMVAAPNGPNGAAAAQYGAYESLLPYYQYRQVPSAQAPVISLYDDDFYERYRSGFGD